MPLFRLATSQNIMNTEGLQGIKPWISRDTLDRSSYLEFLYIGNTIQVSFKDDDEMFKYLKELNEQFETTVVEPKTKLF